MATNFQYVPSSGDLSGKAFEEQTEAAFNELGASIDHSDGLAQEALGAAQRAEGVANQALGQVQVAVTAANAAQGSAAAAQSLASSANAAALDAQKKATEAQTTANVTLKTANDAFSAATNAETIAESLKGRVGTIEGQIPSLEGGIAYAEAQAQRAMGIYTNTPAAEWDDPENPVTPIQFDANDHYNWPEKILLVRPDDPGLDLPPLNVPVELTLPVWLRVEIDDQTTVATQTMWDSAGRFVFRRTATVDDSDPDNPPVVTWSDPSAGSTLTYDLAGATLTRTIGGTTAVARSLFPAGAVFVLNTTLIFGPQGSIGVYAGDADSATINVVTKCISPIGSDEPTQLGNVSAHADLPLTVTGAETVFGRAPAIDDYARVLADENHDGHTYEYYITAIDESGNITWGNEIAINTTDYQAQTSASDSGRILTGGATVGTFGQSLGLDSAPTSGSANLLDSDAVYRATRLSALGAAPASITLADNAGSDVLPDIANGTTTSKIQRMRDNLKSLFNKTAAVFGLGGTPSIQAFGDAANEGSGVTAARYDHKHKMPAAPTTISGNAGTATRWQTARKFAVNLAAGITDWNGTGWASVDGSGAVQVPVGGVLQLANGGTGATTAAAARTALGITSGSGIYNTREVITASGNYTPTVTGWAKVTAIGRGGRGGTGGLRSIIGGLGTSGGGGGGGAAGDVTEAFLFLTVGTPINVIVGYNVSFGPIEAMAGVDGLNASEYTKGGKGGKNVNGSGGSG
ncbi:MAG: hypothetical protein LBV79_10370, partial [Candidatus Adiutrix sp.]|nr:hypothetical protein [Candidatus Adiutrix sp.]